MNTKSYFCHYPLSSRCIIINLIHIITLLSSCVTQRAVEYLQNVGSTSKSYNEPAMEEYRLKPKDELYIQISSLDDPSARIFSSTGNQQFLNIGTIQPYGASLISFTVDKDGLNPLTSEWPYFS